jgi:hypothetical protein
MADPNRVTENMECACSGAELLWFDAGRLDYRPPLFDFGLVVDGKRVWALLIDRHDFLANVEKPLVHSWIGERAHSCGVSFAMASPGVPAGTQSECKAGAGLAEAK